VEFYGLKKCKKKPIAVFKKKKATAPASTADPKKVKKIDFGFCQSFLHFWLRLLDAVLMNTMFIVWK
jgi:hypothetical protein